MKHLCFMFNFLKKSTTIVFHRLVVVLLEHFFFCSLNHVIVRLFDQFLNRNINTTSLNSREYCESM